LLAPTTTSGRQLASGALFAAGFWTYIGRSGPIDLNQIDLLVAGVVRARRRIALGAVACQSAITAAAEEPAQRVKALVDEDKGSDTGQGHNEGHDDD